MNVLLGKKMPRVKSVMTPFPYSVDINAEIERAQEIMREHNIRHLPVLDSGKPVSIITERDINLARIELKNDDSTLRVRDVCTMETYIVDLEEPLHRVALTMSAKQIGAAIVVKEDRLAGIFTMVDACRHFGELLESQFDDSPDDLVG